MSDVAAIRGRLVPGSKLVEGELHADPDVLFDLREREISRIAIRERVFVSARAADFGKVDQDLRELSRRRLLRRDRACSGRKAER